MKPEDLLAQYLSDKSFFTSATYKEICRNVTSNLVASPFSVEILLTLTLLGSKGATAEEIQTKLSFLDCSPEQIESAVKSLMPILTEKQPYCLKIANKLYVSENFKLKETFKNVAVHSFKADSENIGFGEPVEAAKIMNEWIEDQTENKIENLVDPGILNNRTRIILVNALYFKAAWEVNFKKVLTSKKKFYKKKDEVVEVDTMERSFRHNFYECEELDANVLEKKLTGEASMIFVLPNEKEGLPLVEERIEMVLNITPDKFVNEMVKVNLPKFKVVSKLDFKDALQKCGVEKMFKEDEADFSGIAGEKGDLYVNDVIQKVFIAVDEEGVEAAAASAVAVGVPYCAFIPPVPSKKFIADHPFLFYIKVKGLVLFVGKVVDPTDDGNVGM